MSIVFALLAAGANAVATVLQRVGVEEASATPRRPRRSLMALVLRRPIWFVGLALMTASFLLQAIALSLGSLTTVQPVMVSEIVFLVAILGTWFKGALGWREWAGALGTATGLGVFLALSAAKSGTEHPTRSDWVLLLSAAIGATLIFFGVAHRGRRSFRAACYGIAAGITFALTAAFVKTVADEWNRGPVHLFSHFEVYGVALSGLVGLVLVQHALEAGPVAASQSAMLIVNPLASIVMGVWLFGDSVHTSLPRLCFQALALAAMFIGLIVLSHSPLVAQSAAGDRLVSDERIAGLHAHSG